MNSNSKRSHVVLRTVTATIAAATFCSCSTARAAGEKTVPAATTTSATPAAAAPPAGEPEVTLLTDTELGRAVAAIDRDPEKAAKALRALEKKLPWIEDVLEYHEAMARGRFDRSGARKSFEDFLEEHQDSVLLGDAAAELALLLEADHDEKRAVSLADRYGRGGPDTSAAAGVCLSAGRTLAAKDPARAYTYLQCARTKSPLSGAARAAWPLVVTLRAKHAELRPSGAEPMMAEARLLGREGNSTGQAALLREILSTHPGSSVQGEAELAYGRNLGRTGGKAAGADFFEKRANASSGARKAKLLYEAGTLRWNDDRNTEATALFEQMIALKTGIGDEQQALYALARIGDAEGRRSEAIAYYGRAAAAAKGAVRAESQWRQGWVSYRAKDFEAAARSFGSMAKTAPRGSDTDGRSEALYWQGRSLERLGRKAEARECFAQVISEFGSGYYAAAAEKRLGSRSGAAGAVRQPVAPPGLPPAASLAIRRATTLREAGLVTLAARDLSARLKRFDTATRRAVLPALPSSGAYDAAFRIAIEMSDQGELSRDEARVYFYPKAHADIVEREARKAGINPLLVYALMRQESAFATTAVSSAKALGLMQLLESTARRVAAASGLPEPAPEDLFDPAVNIRLGIRYLAELSKLFDGNTALMAAAYNAGETAAGRWQNLAQTYEEDEMIEQISYRETRLYVKSILRNMRNYRRIYGDAATATPVANAG